MASMRPIRNRHRTIAMDVFVLVCLLWLATKRTNIICHRPKYMIRSIAERCFRPGTVERRSLSAESMISIQLCVASRRPTDQSDETMM